MQSDVDTLAKLAEITEQAKSLSDYRKRIRGLVAGLWRGSLTRSQFLDAMLLAVDNGITKAWRAGARSCGVRPSEFTALERDTLNQRILDTYAPAEDFADQVINGNRASGTLLRTHYNRANLWINRYNAVKAEATSLACADQKLTWRLGATEEHCSDCLTYNGRTYRASTWARYGIQPQSFELECNGWLCDCRFEVTDQPVSPGRPPRMSGSES